MSKELIKELELLREYNQKRYLEPRLKLLIDYIDNLEKENIKLNHYKKLYQSVKKHKEDLRSFLIDWKDVLESGKENVEGLDIVEKHELETLHNILAKLEEIEGVSGV